MEIVYHSPLINYGDLVRRFYKRGFVGAAVLLPYVLFCLRLRPTHPMGLGVILFSLALILLGLPVLAACILLHNRLERRTKFIVTNYGVWIEKVGRESRLWRWNDIVRAIDVRKTRSIGLFLKKRSMPTTISGFTVEKRKEFVAYVNSHVREHTDDYHNYLLTSAG